MENNETVYYQGKYCNDIPVVAQEINRRFTGDSFTDWITHFHQFTNRVFKKALFINCGNGWVERDFFDRGLLKEAVGLDVSEVLLNEARSKTDKRSIRYYAGDINLASFAEDGFDLIVNHAAAHHITYIDRVFRKMAAVLSDDGFLVNMDYVGPHRNQYPDSQWRVTREVNASLPIYAQAKLVYPHLPTMLLTDPTEAVDSELVVPTIYKYFNVEYHAKAGRAVAYPILTHNNNIWERSPTEREQVARLVLSADQEYLKCNPDSSLFDYIIATTKRTTEGASANEIESERRECEREIRAIRSGGYYSFPSWPSGEELGFRIGDSGSHVFCEGLSGGEPHGSWTDGPATRLRFTGPMKRAFSLDFEIAPFLGLNQFGGSDSPQAPSTDLQQRIIVIVNGTYRSTEIVKAPGNLSISIKDNYLAPTGEYEINLIFPDAKPCTDNNGLILDARLLSILISKAKLTEL